MPVSEVLSFISLLAYIAAYIIYNHNVIGAKVTSNKITWALWALLTTINAITYSAMSGDVIKSLLVYFGGLLNFITALMLWRKAGKVLIPKEDWIIFAVCLVAIICWLLTREAMYGNMATQIAFILSFLPLMKTVIKEPRSEKPFPWFIFALAYFLMVIVVLLRYKQPQDLIAPGVSMILHALIGILAMRREMIMPQKLR
jgi:drug/metabolite transporter (DMT)-like permease